MNKTWFKHGPPAADPPATLDYAGPPVALYHRWLHRYAVVVAAATFLLIVAGGTVTSTGSGLAVPDWPTTWGHNMFAYPPSKWVGNILYEHVHRLVASTVGLMTVFLAVWLALKEPRRQVRWLGWAALGLVIVQGVLGGLTVLYLLPTAISVFHGCLAQLFFCVVLSIALFTSAGWLRRTMPAPTPRPLPLTHLSVALVFVVFGQLVLGALMRHSMKDLEAGLAIPDFPLAYGQILPDLSPAAIERYNELRRWEYQMQPVHVDQIRFHLAHRAWALVVSALLLTTCALVFRRHGAIRELRRLASALVVLLVGQLALGAATIWTNRDPAVATAHVAAGALILGSAWLLALHAYRRLAPVPAAPVAPVLAEGAPA